ncbi:MAG: hypothetical protein O7A04_00915 [Acidobacteria bacterium]|nr:hypothetical protein [Acidobacteriota bacterium]
MIRHEERLLLLLVTLVVLFFLALDLHYAGSLVLPLDDSYIYAQYARSIAAGHAFRFTPQADATVGVTGLLYPLLLAAIYKLGLSGDALPAAMFILNALLLAVSTLLVYRITSYGGRREIALLAAVLFALSGPLAWGFLSGMELGLFCTLWLAVTWALLLDSPLLLAVWASALAWVRPEGWLWCWVLAVGAPWFAGRSSRVAASWAGRWLPVAAGALPVVFNLLLAGSLSPASARLKSPLYLPELHLPTILQHAVGFLATVGKRLLTGVGGPDVSGPLNRPDAWMHAAPLTLLLIVVAVGLAGRRRAGAADRDGSFVFVGGAALWATWLGVDLLWVAFTTGASTHHFRHLLPAWPAVVLLTADGAAAMSTALASTAERARGLRRAFGGYLVIFAVLSVLSFGLLFGQEAHAFSRHYLRTARWINRNLPADARIASLDAGFLGYYSGREFFDLFGLTTPSMLDVTVFYADDEGTKCELMESMAPELRPTHFVLHEERFDHADWNPYLALAKRAADGQVQIAHESQVLLDVPLVGRNLQVWEADWSIAGSGDRPGDPLAAGRVIDRVDIGDPVSESAHRVEIVASEPGFFGRNRYHRFPGPDGRDIADGGRAVAGRLTLRLGPLTPGRDVELRLRTLPTDYDTPLAVSVDSQALGAWRLPPAGPGWRETAILIPGSAIRRPLVTFDLEGVAMVYHVWALRTAPSAGPQGSGDGALPADSLGRGKAADESP